MTNLFSREELQDFIKLGQDILDGEVDLEEVREAVTEAAQDTIEEYGADRALEIINGATAIYHHELSVLAAKLENATTLLAAVCVETGFDIDTLFEEN